MSVQIIPLTNDGEGHINIVLGSVSLEFVTRFNYTASCWTMDILDSQGVLLIAGLMLVPLIDLLSAYGNLKEMIGSLVLVENYPGAYLSPDSLGVTTGLAWFAPGQDISFE